MSDKILSKTKVCKYLVDALNEKLTEEFIYKYILDIVEVSSIKDEKTGSTRIDIKIKYIVTRNKMETSEE